MFDRILSFARDHMVDDARDWWRWWSVRLLALALALQTLQLTSPDSLVAFWQAIPPSLRAFLPAWLNDLITLLLMFAALIARHWKQPPPPRAPS
jgi:hypothetical protein